MEMYGPVEVELEFGRPMKRYFVSVFGVQMKDDCILGVDFLMAHDAVVNFGEQELRMSDTRISFRVASEKGAAVALVTDVCVPAWSEKVVWCRCDGIENAVSVVVECGEHDHLAPGLMVGRSFVNSGTNVIPVWVGNFSSRPAEIKAGTVIGRCVDAECKTFSADVPEASVLPPFLYDLFSRSTVHLTASEAQQVKELLARFAVAFSSGDTDLGCTDIVQHTIDTGIHRPIKIAHRRVAPAQREELQRLMSDYIEQGIVEPSTSPWCAPVVLVKKKDGSMRFCVDFRELNKATAKDSYPLPRIDDMLDSLTGASWFSTLDLKSGYHQVQMHAEDRPKTAFSYGQGLWQFRVMPFGLCNAPATFQRLMERVLSGLQWNTAMIYLDDVICIGWSFQKAYHNVIAVLERFRACGLKLHPKKCNFFQKEVKFLGHIVSAAGVHTDPDKISVVRDWPLPHSADHVKSFLGLCTYYRRFVEGFATLAAPLHRLVDKRGKFVWDEEADGAFSRLKRALCTAPVLPFPDPSAPYVLDCDASNHGIGGVLSQVKNGHEYVIAYFSRALSRPERNYCVTRRELLAIVKSLGHFHAYLYGVPFTVRTDHSALTWLRNLRNPEGQLARWIGKLEQYEFVIVYRAGSKHSNADSLSRRPCDIECQHCSKREVSVEQALCHRTQLGPCQGRLGNLQNEQERDGDLGPLVSWLCDSPARPNRETLSRHSPATKAYVADWEMLRLHNGALQRKWESTDGRRTEWLWVLPSALRPAIMKEMHDQPSGGHFGAKKTLSRLKQRYYWIGMRKDVTEWCKACHVCCSRIGPVRSPLAPMQLYHVGAPMERVAVHIKGPSHEARMVIGFSV